MSELPVTTIGEVLKTEEKPSQNGKPKIRTGRRKRPRRVLIYGVQGVGKSTFAASAPSPIFIDTEGGLNDIDVEGAFETATSLEDVRQQLKFLAESEHDYKTIVIDSIDWLEKLIWQHVCKQYGVESISDIDYGKGYGFAAEVWRKVLGSLDKLRDKGMGIVLVGHSKIVRVDPPDVDPYDRYMVDLHKEPASMLQEWCDEVLFACYKLYTKVQEGDFGRKSYKALGGERILRTQEQPFCQAKSRLSSLPEEIPLSWAEYAQAVNAN